MGYILLLDVFLLLLGAVFRLGLLPTGSCFDKDSCNQQQDHEDDEFPLHRRLDLLKAEC